MRKKVNDNTVEAIIRGNTKIIKEIKEFYERNSYINLLIFSWDPNIGKFTKNCNQLF